LTLTLDEIDQEVKKLERESKALKHELFKMAWFMRGSLSIEQAYMLDQEDREIISKIILENIENSKTTGMPLI
jgi:hypothetical protein